ncbi:hypothetical protein PEPCOX59622_01329 [Aedoeadaptatus coxii]|uniref:hypothetical protein n=1 Tax=Aedoeadaptatus coxii TaxID=755172 RepID=UPI00176340D3|nr:hypothetical protein [Peptoniphilus coxii]CAC9933429.1 hypothetical protein PEPCOX59622_01329 [Peptoniphilus coxii]
MKNLITKILYFAVIVISSIIANYFVSMRIYGHWQFSDYYKNSFYWIFMGATLFFSVLFSAVFNHRKKTKRK